MRKKYTKEKKYGPNEYKYVFDCCDDPIKLERRETQMNFRLIEGKGECMYFIGTMDNGKCTGISKENLVISLENLNYLSNRRNAKIVKVTYFKGFEGYIAEVTIKSLEKKKTYINSEIKIGLIGEQNSGKSTLIGVLKTGKKDDGNGSAREGVFRHAHEILNGMTSSLSHQIIGLNEKGFQNLKDRFTYLSVDQILRNSSKIVNFYDMGGKYKYLLKTVYL